jgi:hypothetical protein
MVKRSVIGVMVASAVVALLGQSDLRGVLTPVGALRLRASPAEENDEAEKEEWTELKSKLGNATELSRAHMEFVSAILDKGKTMEGRTPDGKSPLETVNEIGKRLLDEKYQTATDFKELDGEKVTNLKQLSGLLDEPPCPSPSLDRLWLLHKLLSSSRERSNLACRLSTWRVLQEDEHDVVLNNFKKLLSAGRFNASWRQLHPSLEYFAPEEVLRGENQEEVLSLLKTEDGLETLRSAVYKAFQVTHAKCSPRKRSFLQKLGACFIKSASEPDSGLSAPALVLSEFRNTVGQITAERSNRIADRSTEHGEELERWYHVRDFEHGGCGRIIHTGIVSFEDCDYGREGE